MSSGVKTVAAASAISVLLSVSITAAHTTANLQLGDWVVNGDSSVTSAVSGTTTLVDCPLTNCDINYNGSVAVNLTIENNQLVLDPVFTMSEASLLEAPVIPTATTDQEVTNQTVVDNSQVASDTTEETSSQQVASSTSLEVTSDIPEPVSELPLETSSVESEINSSL